MKPDFGEPEAEWTDDYEWGRYRGPQPWPAPAGWVISDEAFWQRYPGIGEGMGSNYDVDQALDEDLEAVAEARDVEAYLLDELLEFDPRKEVEVTEWELVVAGETVFRRVDPAWDDLLATTAEALSRYANDQDLDGLEPETGDPPADVQKARETERRQETNESLADFGGGDGDE